MAIPPWRVHARYGPALSSTISRLSLQGPRWPYRRPTTTGRERSRHVDGRWRLELTYGVQLAFIRQTARTIAAAQVPCVANIGEKAVTQEILTAKLDHLVLKQTCPEEAWYES
jgi:hypothetical protein